MTIQVWYHSNCYDGFGAAWAASKALGRGPDVLYVPVTYGHPFPPCKPEDKIYIVDFSYPRDVLATIKANVSFLQVIDHHKTAEEALQGLPYCLFDMNRSGAGLTWDYFHPGEPRPLLIDLIEDRDLWRWKVEGSKAFHAYILSQPFDFEIWDKVSCTLEDNPDVIFNMGEVLLRSQAQLVTKICSKAWLCSVYGGLKVAVVNTGSHWSEVGHELLQKFPEADFAASFTVENHSEVLFSLRSEGDFDVSAVAKNFHGGGHKNAAGFKVPIDSLGYLLAPWCLSAINPEEGD